MPSVFQKPPSTGAIATAFLASSKAREGLRRCGSALVASSQARLLQPWAESVSDFEASQITMVSPHWQARRLPSGLKATLWTPGTLRVRTSWPLGTSHSFTSLVSPEGPKLLLLAVARRLPSGLKDRLATPDRCPLRVRTS